MKKKWLIVLFIITITAMLFNSSCKTAEEIVYSLVGAWTLNFTWADTSTSVVELNLMSGGTGTNTSWGYPVTWTVTGSNFQIKGDNVAFLCTWHDTFTGSFTSEVSIQGNFTGQGEGLLCGPNATATFVGVRH